MNKPSYKCIEIYPPSPSIDALAYAEKINEIIGEQEIDGYAYHETVVMSDRILIYFKLSFSAFTFDNSTSIT